MFQYVHHVHYVVHDLDAMIEYMEKNFGLKPDHRELSKHNGPEAHYNIGRTQIQFTAPTDPESGQGRHLAKHGPGVYHVAWGVDDIGAIARTLAEHNIKTRYQGNEGVAGEAHTPRTASHTYVTLNIDPAYSHGVQIQMVGPR
jgi:methylmalonyl-CoA/ethylmalonyl-CoA epimerase